MDTSNKKHTFHVHGMHCNSCVMIIENSLTDVSGIKRVKASLKSSTVDVEMDSDINPEQLASNLTAYVREHGYEIKTEKQKFTVRWKDFYYAIPIAIVLVGLFVWLQKAGLVNLINSSEVSYPVAFLIGVIASLSSCLAVVGGLLLSISAEYAKEGTQIKPHIMFHIGRLVTFFILGGVIGFVGSAFTLSNGMTVVLSVLIGLVMLSLGINLLNIFPWAKVFQLRMPRFLARSTIVVKKIEYGFAPFLIGASTFFLPCGFTQSMQVYSLSTGSFLTGALTMTAFALGTLPVLAAISFTSFRLSQGPTSRANIFLKTAGILVIVFALLNIMNGLVVAGVIRPLFNF